MKNILFLVLLFVLPVSAQVRIHSDYPGGNIRVDKIQNDTVWLQPDLRDTNGFWFYWNFAVQRAKGKTLTFKLPNDCFTRAGVAVSTDKGQNWEWQQPEAFYSRSFNYTFTSNKEVRFAFAIPYTQANWDKFVSPYRKHPDFDFSTLTRTKKGRDVEMLTIRQAGVSPKVKVLFTARHHACEMTANFVMEGIIEGIVADEWLKKNAEFRFIPFVDKDGVEDGDQGKNRHPWDHNRDYSENSIYETTSAIKEVIPAWTGGKKNVVFDLHCPYSHTAQNDTIFLVGSKDKEMEAKQLRLSHFVLANNKGELVYDPISFSYYGGKPWTLLGTDKERMKMGTWGQTLKGNIFSGSLEMPYGVNGNQLITEQNARAFGRDLIAGLRDYLKEVLVDNISGIYPGLAYYNLEGECGTGAVVPWADRLWLVTYAPHSPMGSSDKLYEITPDYQQIVHQESIGGTPANRMIHKESNQLFIGPYAIDSERQVRVIPYDVMPGRHTGNARHLSSPAEKIYYGTMEEGFYEVDVKTLEVHTLYKDGNVIPKLNGEPGHVNELLVGSHGKGFYSGQGVLVYSNNGEDSQEAKTKFDAVSGALAEWDGKDWKIIRRNQFVEVTGPGGIYGNEVPGTDPIWTTGWDHKSVLLGVRDAKKGWSFYRLPKASHSYDGAHGWNTEWPRIRNVGTEGKPDYLMTMHGMFWRFPHTFSVDNTAGIRPRTAYLKVIGDFARWNDRLVFGCDDSAHKEFLNKRSAKGGIEGPGQSNSNLWFTPLNKPDLLGPATAEGAVWMNENLKDGECSEPFLFAGWNKRCVWIKNGGKEEVTFTFEADVNGNGAWTEVKSISVPAGKSRYYAFTDQERGEWVRVSVDKSTQATVSFNYTSEDKRTETSAPMFKGLASVGNREAKGGLLYGLGNDRRSLGLLTDAGYYEMHDKLELVKADDAETARFISENFKIPTSVVTIDQASVLVVDDAGRRWRLPLGDEAYREATRQDELRICREVATERDLFSCMGTFYELPAENADGYAKIRPISTHSYQINDYASYRGMLVMTGIDPKEEAYNPHIVWSDDMKVAAWVGVIDDLWSLGKPRGEGGPWKNTNVQAGVYSDPYLMAFYDRKSLTLEHASAGTVHVTIEIDPTGNGDWMEYEVVSVEANQKKELTFPDAFQARWVRLKTDTDTTITSWFVYQ